MFLNETLEGEEKKSLCGAGEACGKSTSEMIMQKKKKADELLPLGAPALLLVCFPRRLDVKNVMLTKGEALEALHWVLQGSSNKSWGSFPGFLPPRR